MAVGLATGSMAFYISGEIHADNSAPHLRQNHAFTDGTAQSMG